MTGSCVWGLTWPDGEMIGFCTTRGEDDFLRLSMWRQRHSFFYENFKLCLTPCGIIWWPLKSGETVPLSSLENIDIKILVCLTWAPSMAATSLLAYRERHFGFSTQIRFKKTVIWIRILNPHYSLHADLDPNPRSKRSAWKKENF